MTDSSTHSRKIQLATLCFLRKEDMVLLAMKKRGFGEGKWNGAGGKVQPEESIAEAAIRETQEEIGAIPEDIIHMGILTFTFQQSNPKDEWDQEVHVYFCEKWSGEVTESEEMKPKWFALSEIPYEEMWVDDKFWLPQVLAGEKVTGTFIFDTHMKLVDYSVTFAT